MRHGTLILGSSTNYFFFSTVDTDGAPITLAGTPSLACNVNGGTAATSGLTLSVDHGSVTGRHRVAVDVDDATLALADGDMVEVYIAAGTVDAVSVVGAQLAALAISDGSLLSGTQTDIRTALGLATANMDTQLSTIDTVVDSILVDTGTTLDGKIDTIDANVDSILVDTAEIGAAGAGLTALASAADLATVDTNVDAILVDTGTTLQAELDGIQADTEDIQSRLPAALNNGAIPADIQRINDVAVTGDGSATPFGV